MTPTFKYEKLLWKRGFKIVAGMDEVGRGCFAGPVVAGAVAFARFVGSEKWEVSGLEGIKIDDSKKLTERQRLVADEWIKQNSLTWGVGRASVAEINKKGMAKATASAFRRAARSAQDRTRNRVDYLLIDAFFIPYIRQFPSWSKSSRKTLNNKLNGKNLNKFGEISWTKNLRQLPIIDGDAKSFSIAAASIIAKVYRDALMTKLSKNRNYKKYNWNKNKGYGTKEHQEVILKYGTTRYHRKQFVQTFKDRIKD